MSAEKLYDMLTCSAGEVISPAAVRHAARHVQDDNVKISASRPLNSHFKISRWPPVLPLPTPSKGESDQICVFILLRLSDFLLFPCRQQARTTRWTGPPH